MNWVYLNGAFLDLSRVSCILSEIDLEKGVFILRTYYNHPDTTNIITKFTCLVDLQTAIRFLNKSLGANALSLPDRSND
jgi:hypothetical protein